MPERPILIIDDDPAIRATVAEILTSEGYSVATAINGADGLQSLDRIDPALVLLDMRMPILDGWGFARALQSRGIQIPILVMTAAQDARRWAREINAEGYVAKPFDLIDLLDTVGRFFPAA
jgi:two-component system chemotaxis response regulator CheY